MGPQLPQPSSALRQDTQDSTQSSPQDAQVAQSGASAYAVSAPIESEEPEVIRGATLNKITKKPKRRSPTNAAPRPNVLAPCLDIFRIAIC